MIIGNITTFIGMDGDAEHYYCSFGEIDKPNKFNPMPYVSNDNELFRKLSSNIEVLKLIKKDRYSRYKLGDETNRFNSIQEIHDTLIEKYSNDDIVTYYESSPFKDMLFILNGENLGYKAIGEVWTNVPRSCWKDLLPEDLTEIKIKCFNCAQTLSIEDILDDSTHHKIENRELVNFNINKRDMLEPCCHYPDLVWNILL